MTNEEVIEPLVQDNWVITCTTKQDINSVLHACENAEIEWRTGDIATQFIPHESCPICIVYCKYNNYIFYDNGRYEKYYEEHGYENITNWFFDAIKHE